MSEHYRKSRMESIEIMHNALSHEQLTGFLLGNAYKYMHRYPHKGNPLGDLNKAVTYLEALMIIIEDPSVTNPFEKIRNSRLDGSFDINSVMDMEHDAYIINGSSLEIVDRVIIGRNTVTAYLSDGRSGIFYTDGSSLSGFGERIISKKSKNGRTHEPSKQAEGKSL